MQSSAEEIKEVFDDWWNSIGSGIKPLPGEDDEEFARRLAFRAFDYANDIYED